HPEWTFHLVGKNFEDGYSEMVATELVNRKLQDHVFLYGSRSDIDPIIKQCDIAILTSKSEGLPVALLEVGLCRKPVVVTAVGEIPLILEHGKNGFVLEPNDVQGFYESVVKLIENDDLRSELGCNLFEIISQNNTTSAIMGTYIDWITN